MSKRLILVALAALALLPPLKAQEVTRSRQVPGLRTYDLDLAVMSQEEKDSVMMVAELWKNYVESFSSSSVTESDRRSMWVDGSPDYLLEFDDGVLLYSSFRENRILDIRKIASGAYQMTVQTASKLPGEDNYGWVESVYRVCAESVDTSNVKGFNPFRLRNWLDIEVPSLRKVTFAPLDYYLVQGCDIPAKVAEQEALFLSAFTEEYGIELPGNIRYVVAPTVDQCERMSGFLFNAYSNPLMSSALSKASGYRFYGRCLGTDTILSNYYDDRHDLILMMSRLAFPNALPMIQEGLAVFHGGFMDYSYDAVKGLLSAFLDSAEEIDLSVEDLFYDVTMPLSVDGDPAAVVVPMEGFLGGVLVGEAWERGGSSLVKRLLECDDYLAVLNVLDIEPFAVRDWLRNSL